MPVQIQLRHDTAANWTAANPTLALGEVGAETNTGNLKVGDGATAWNSLGYAPGLTLGSTPSTQAFGDSAAGGSASTASKNDHKHAMPADPVTAHAAASDPHTGYQKESEKGAASGYASLGAGGLVPMAQLASGTADGTKYIRDDGTLVTPAAGGMTNPMTTLDDLTVGGTVTGGVAAPARLGKGTDGQVLTVDPTTHHLLWAAPAGGALTTKGDLLGFSTAAARVPIGADTQVLTADSTQTLGLKWAAAGGGGGRALVDPTGLSWSWLNQRSCTITTQGATLALKAPADTTDSFSFRVKSLAYSKPYYVIVHWLPAFFTVNYPGVSVGWLQTSDNKFAISGFFGASLASSYTTSPWAVTNNWVTTPPPQIIWEWIALVDTSTNRQIYVSRDGYTWILLHSIATNSIVTPDRLVFGVEARNASFPVALIIDSWEEVSGAWPY